MIQRCNYQNTDVGDQITFKESGPHWFTTYIENAKTLKGGQKYTVSKISVASSSTSVKLKETGELEFSLGWFTTNSDKTTNKNDPYPFLKKKPDVKSF